MKIPALFLLFSLILNSACMSSRTELSNPEVEVIGHRGHVSAYPENSITGFLSAVALGVDALELDLVISADRQVLVSHEPFMKSTYMLTPEGERISKSREKTYNLYKMSYESIQKFKSGEVPNSKFRNQRRIDAHKPLLKTVLDTVEAFSKKRGLEPVKFYLEIKSDPKDYGVFQPEPQEFVDNIMQSLEGIDLEDRIVFMSFDAEILNIIKRDYPHLRVSYLLYRKEIEAGLKELHFKPEFLSPYHKLLKKAETVSSLQEQGIKVIPWTVNRKKDIFRMFNFGVDGIISDQPQRVLREKNKLKGE